MEGQTRHDREWEHWPGRDASDAGTRHRLRALFTPTDVMDSVGAMLDAQSRELEQRGEELAHSVTDLEQREERVRTLRTTVEDILRNGSAELDARHAELDRLARDLDGRAAALRASEQELEGRRRELGAVELRSAAVERREEALERRSAELDLQESRTAAAGDTTGERDELEALRKELVGRTAQLERGLDDLASARRALTAAEASLAARERIVEEREARLRDQPAARANPAPGDASGDARATEPAPSATSHIAFLASDEGYRIVERSGPAPAAGSILDVDGARYAVDRIARSPLPGDQRRCAFAARLSTGA